MNDAVPVLYYHSVGDHAESRPWSFLTTPVEVFVAQMRYLVEAGYHFADFDEVYGHLNGTTRLPRKSVFLHFDDGFLDNYAIAWPIAKTLGVRFTVFVSPEFVDPRPLVRPTLDDVAAGRITAAELPWWGYLSWDELRVMQSSGVVDVQSHALTHTWYPVRDAIVDFHRPGDAHYWLYWNRRPERKPYWLSEYRYESVPLGTPVYEHAESLIARVFTPDDRDLEEALCAYVAEHGGAEFFRSRHWRARLEHVCEKRGARRRGRAETIDEQRARCRFELAESKRCIEEKLDKPVTLLAWPGGRASEQLLELARDVGYLAGTNGSALNRPAGDPSRIMRGAGWVGAPAPVWLQKAYLRSQLDRLSGSRTLLGGMGAAMRGLRNLRRRTRRSPRNGPPRVSAGDLRPARTIGGGP